MDLFKETNVVKATSEDFNAQKVVILRDRKKISKSLNRYSRRKLKQDLSKSELI